MTIEKYVPILSTRGANYPAGAESWQGTPTRVALSAAEQAAGMVPNTPVDAQSFNHLMGLLGEHLEAIVDAPSFNWTSQPVYTNAELSSDTTGNRNQTGDPALLYAAGERWIIKTVGGGTGVCFHSYLQGRGNTYEANADTNLFIASADSGAGATATILASPSTNRIVVMSSAGVARYTDDYGATWSAGGTAFDTAAQPSAGGFYRSGRWVEVHTSMAPTYVSYTTTLSGTWTNGGNYTATDSVNFRRMITDGGNTAIFLPDVCPTTTEFLVDTGSGFGLVNTGAGASSGWRGCYHDLLGKFFATNLAGQLWSSSTGASWALEGTLASGAYDVVPHGRGLVVSTETEDFTGPATYARLTYVSWDRSQTMVERRMPWSSPAALYPRFHLIRHRGRVVAGKMNIPSGQTERLEYWLSHVHPAHLATTGL